jgi:hypothetical protein
VILNLISWVSLIKSDARKVCGETKLELAISVAEPHHFYAVQPSGKNTDAALAAIIIPA